MSELEKRRQYETEHASVRGGDDFDEQEPPATPAPAEALRAALENIRRIPVMPFPDAGAHSWRTFGEAVFRAWSDIQSLAATTLAQYREALAAAGTAAPALKITRERLKERIAADPEGEIEVAGTDTGILGLSHGNTADGQRRNITEGAPAAAPAPQTPAASTNVQTRAALKDSSAAPTVTETRIDAIGRPAEETPASARPDALVEAIELAFYEAEKHIPAKEGHCAKCGFCHCERGHVLAMAKEGVLTALREAAPSASDGLDQDAISKLETEAWDDGFESGVECEAMRRDHPEEYQKQADEVKQVLMRTVENYRRDRAALRQAQGDKRG